MMWLCSVLFLVVGIQATLPENQPKQIENSDPLLDSNSQSQVQVGAAANLPTYNTHTDKPYISPRNVGGGGGKLGELEDIPRVAPQDLVARAYNSTALNVTWSPVLLTRERMRGRLIGHRLKYWKKGYPEEDSVYYLSRTTRPWAIIVGLQPDTYYFVKVMVYNAAGEGPESERYLERTYRKAPQKPPSSVHVYGIDPSTVRVVWRYKGVTMEEEPIQGYKVRLWEADQDMATANDTIIKTRNRLESYISNLTPGQAYRMRVLAFSNGGDGRMSSPELHFQMGTTNKRNSALDMKLNKTIWFGLLSVYYWLKQTLL